MSERTQRKAAVGWGTTEAVTVTCKSTLDVRMSIHDKWDLPDQAEGVRAGKGAPLHWNLPGSHKDLNGRVTLSNKASFIILCSYFLTLAAQALMGQPHLLPTSRFCEGNVLKNKMLKEWCFQAVVSKL